MPAVMSDTKSSSNKAGYHHGNLRDHLIAATRSLIASDGSESFKVADACRHAGVSTAAPYRHFSDRQALLEAVAIAGFHDLRDEARAAGKSYVKGSAKAVSAVGKAYVVFACKEPNLFRLMFSHNAVECSQQLSNNHLSNNQLIASGNKTIVDAKNCANSSGIVSDRMAAGRECYEVLLEQLVITLKREVIDEEVLKAAFPLWTFVHGLSFLAIDGNLAVNQLPIDIMEQIDWASARLMP